MDNSFLKNKRLEKNMTLEQVGKLAGVGKSTVRKWENGMIENMKRDNIVSLAKALDISPLDILGIERSNSAKSLEVIYDQLESARQHAVYDFAKYQLKEQTRKPKIIVKICGYVSAGTGEWTDGNQMTEEVEVYEEVPQHDFAVKVNGDSMTPIFQDKEVIYVKKVNSARNGQIVICRIAGELFVKKIMNGQLISLNKKYKPIPIHEYDDFEIQGVVVM